MSDTQRHLSIWLLLIMGLAALRPRMASADDPNFVDSFGGRLASAAAPAAAQPSEDVEIPYSQFIAQVDRNRIAEVVIFGQSIQGVMRDGRFFRTVTPGTNHRALVATLIRDHARVTGVPPALLSNEDWLNGLSTRQAHSGPRETHRATAGGGATYHRLS
jgi:hypothetical protein